MINEFFKKARKAPWVLGQRLTKKPSNPKSVISDMFVWRCNQDWNTYFELLDIAKLLDDKRQHQVDVVFFDDHGDRFHHQTIELNGLNRQILDISQILSVFDKLPSCHGTFCIFHQQVPGSVYALQSFITERGYVSYQYKNASLRSYVHGNLDAIDDTLTTLGGSSFFNRRFNLQYLLEPNKYHEIALVNASPSNKKVDFEVVNFDGKIQIKENTVLKAKQVFVFPIKNLPSHSRLIIKSKMIMARPIVFCFDNEKMDVFHG